jgi:outer membrane protein OmpA-like peptidoglycan-associated protein
MAIEGQRKEQEDFYVTHKDENWSKAEPVREINNPAMNEGAPSLSPDGQLLIYTACADMTGSYGEGKRGLGSCDLFYAWREGNRWGKAKNMGPSINSSHWETQPSFSSDGKTLYFIRGLKKGHQVKNQDIWMSQIDASGGWTKAVRLGELINTPQDESSVLIHPDGQSLYFTSDGHPGMGGEDIFLSRKDKEGNWGKPINLGYPINTHKDENSITVTADGRMALFASDREGGYGALDLYQFELPAEFRPVRVNYMQGTVTDKETGKPLGSRFELIDLETGELVIESYSNQVDGKFLVSLPEGKDYALNVSRKNYLFHSENFAMKEGTEKEPFEMEVKLSPIKAGESVVLRNVFFDTDSYVLKDESKSELDELFTFLQRNYKLKIEVSGHTDDRGGEALNMTLSQNRAKAVAAFLTEKGVPAERIIAKGYGSSAPISSNDTEEGRAQNRRTEFRVLSVE